MDKQNIIDQDCDEIAIVHFFALSALQYQPPEIFPKENVITPSSTKSRGLSEQTQERHAAIPKLDEKSEMNLHPAPDCHQH
jgi:hypothetical protein